MSLSDLKNKSREANELIERLQKQIEDINLANKPDQVEKRTKELRSENEKLRKEVDKLLKELGEAEKKNNAAGGSNYLHDFFVWIHRIKSKFESDPDFWWRNVHHKKHLYQVRDLDHL